MTDEQAPEAGTATRASVTVLGVGERLRSARRARALSLQQVAEALRLEEPSIVALEESRFEALGAPVFVRGHLRRYAELLGLPPDGVLDAYRAAAPGSDSPPDLGRPRPRPEGVAMPKWMRWAAPALVLATAAVAINANFGDSARAPEVARPVEIAPAAIAPAPLPAAAKSTVRLVVGVSADAWIVIDDAERRVLYGLQLRDSRQEFDVRPPLRISTTNAAAVMLAINGQDIAIPPENIVRNEANFEWTPTAPPEETPSAAAAPVDTVSGAIPPATPTVPAPATGN